MTEKTVLRIYMTASEQFKGPRTVWQKIFGPSLGGYLLKKAKEFGIEQAVFQKVMAGYLKGKRLVFDQAEVSPPDLPHCLELIDKDEVVQRFINKYQEHLDNCHLIFLHAKEIADGHPLSQIGSK